MKNINRCMGCGSTHFTIDGSGNHRCRHCGYVIINKEPKTFKNTSECLLDMINETLIDLGETGDLNKDLLSDQMAYSSQSPPSPSPEEAQEVERNYITGKQMTFRCANHDCSHHLSFDPIKVRLRDVPKTCRVCGASMILGRTKNGD